MARKPDIDLESIPIFLINLKRATGRKERMIKRLTNLGLLGQTTLIEGIDAGFGTNNVNPDVVKATEGYTPTPNGGGSPAEVGCLLSHIKALHLFVDTTDAEYALILEDDVMFQENFRERIASLRFPRPKPPVVMLCQYTAGGREHPIDDHFLSIVWDTWNTGAYLIHRDYAIQALEKYDRPLAKIENVSLMTAEMITTKSGGIALRVPCIIPEDVDSYIRPFESVASSIRHFNEYRRWARYS